MKKDIKILTILYFVVGFSEVFAEYYNNKSTIYFLKSLILPSLAILYIRSTNRINMLYILALFLNVIASIYFVSKDLNAILTGTLFHSLHRILILYLILKNVKIINKIIVVLGCLPFLLIFGYTAFLTYDLMGNTFFVFIIQSILLSFMGGLAISNYIFENDNKSLFLLLSATFFEITQILFVIRLYFDDIQNFQPLLMFLFVFAQYFFYMFLIKSENDFLLNVEVKQ